MFFQNDIFETTVNLLVDWFTSLLSEISHGASAKPKIASISSRDTTVLIVSFFFFALVERVKNV